MTRAALDLVLNDPDRFVMTEEERHAYERLAVFFGTAAVDPTRFPLSPRQATRIKSIVRKAKGPAQPQSRRNKRKARQERRQGFAKRRRKELKENREAYNEAYKAMLAEREEMEKAFAEVQERIANEPKFDIFDAVGNLIMSGVPESVIKPQRSDDEGIEPIETSTLLRPTVILPSDLEQ